MIHNRWDDKALEDLIQHTDPGISRAITTRAYSTRLLESETKLGMSIIGGHALKYEVADCIGERRPVLMLPRSEETYSKIAPEAFGAIDLKFLRNILNRGLWSGIPLRDAIRAACVNRPFPFDADAALMHAAVPGSCSDITQPPLALALAELQEARTVLYDALGPSVGLLPFYDPGMELATRVMKIRESNPEVTAVIIRRLGLLTWGSDAQASYNRQIGIVADLEAYVTRHSPDHERTPLESSKRLRRYSEVAPVLRHLCAVETGDPDRPFKRPVLSPIVTPEACELVDAYAKDRSVVIPRFSYWQNACFGQEPLVVDDPDAFTHRDKRAILQSEVLAFRDAEEPGAGTYPGPRLLMIPQIGAVVVAENGDARADMARELGVIFEAHALVSRMRDHNGFSLESPRLPTVDPAHVQSRRMGVLEDCVAVISGAAGAIGIGIGRELLRAGACVAMTDLPGERLERAVAELRRDHASRVLSVAIDVASPEAVAEGFQRVILEWGGIDLVIPNAAVSHLSPVASLTSETFQRLSRVNAEGVLHFIHAAANHFRHQGMGGHIVLMSTGSVFAPGPDLGAYGATKAAAHHLALVASQELAPIGVRVNIVAPDAVMYAGEHKSGLWSTVARDRQQTEGKTDDELLAFYREKSLLKMNVRAEHVGRAVLFFATHQTPTTGITLPVDAGLPGASPR